MKYSFNVFNENILTRKFGGTTFGIAEPYVTGYHFIWFEVLPPDLITYLGSEVDSGIDGEAMIKKILAGTCLSVTPPGGTLNKVELTGLGGVKWAVPGNIDYGNTVSVKFLEMSKTPILNIMHCWVKMIRDYRTGVAHPGVLESGDDGAGYQKNKYGATMYYWTTAPDGKTIEYYACYDGMFPAKDPSDLYTSDVETVGKLDIEVEFNVDYAWRELWVKDKCKSFQDTFEAGRDAVYSYGSK